MLLLTSFFTALLLVTGQSLWKVASKTFTNSGDAGIVEILLRLIFSWQFMLGAFLYVVATLIYVWLFSKYSYHSVQLSLVSFNILLSIAIATLLFKEGLVPLNYLGGFLILIGVILATWKK